MKFLKDDKEILENSDLIVQLGMLSDDKILIKENQILIGVLNPYDNKEKLENTKKLLFFFRFTSNN